MLISLPWPDSRLSPNARLYWAAKVAPKKIAREGAAWATKGAEGFHAAKAALTASEGHIPLTVRFYPPDRRHRDTDNMVASLKAAIDGIADALEVNDRRFRPHWFFEDSCPPGRVEVEFDCGQTGERFSDNSPCHAVNGSPQ